MLYNYYILHNFVLQTDKIMGNTKVRISIDIEYIDGDNEAIKGENERMAKALEHGITSTATIEELASMCYQSVSTFKRRFRSRYSMSPHQWLLKYKLELAHRIIKEREVSITELTKLCGFNNTSHFIHRFRKRYGISPARLSKQLRTEGAETENIHNEVEHK